MARYDRRDAWHQRAKRTGYRSRAAFKLEEVQRRHRLLRRGQRVMELGCWPGGWLQVAARSVGPGGRVVGVDLRPLDEKLENENVIALRGDFREAALRAALLDALGGPADVLLSDAAPKLTGVRATDRAQEEALLLGVEAALPELLAPGGDLLVKLLDCPEAGRFVTRTRHAFGSARSLRPQATRRGSSERYLLARNYQGASRPVPSR